MRRMANTATRAGMTVDYGFTGFLCGKVALTMALRMEVLSFSLFRGWEAGVLHGIDRVVDSGSSATSTRQRLVITVNVVGGSGADFVGK